MPFDDYMGSQCNYIFGDHAWAQGVKGLTPPGACQGGLTPHEESEKQTAPEEPKNCNRRIGLSANIRKFTPPILDKTPPGCPRVPMYGGFKARQIGMPGERLCPL